MDTSPYWKKVWYTITGQNRLITKADIKALLGTFRKELVSGVTIFKGFSQENFDDWKKKNKAIENTPAHQLAWKLSKILNLETAMAWKVFCNFLMFEYHALLEDIVGDANYEDHHSRLLEQTWLFYSSERLFLIKTFKYMLEHCLNERHKFNKTYMEFISTFKFTNLRLSLYREFEYLLNEITAESSKHCPLLRDWANRNLQEQYEVLSCIVLSEEFIPPSIEEFKALFCLFRQHNFTSDPVFYDVLQHLDPVEVKKLRRLEVVAMLFGLAPFWEDLKFWTPHADEIEQLLLTVSYESELCVVLLAWTTLQMLLPTKIATERFNTHYHKFTKAALKENVFVSMHDIATDKAIKGLSSFPVIVQVLYTVFDKVCDKFDDEGSLLQHAGVVPLSIELIKHPKIAEKFYSHGDNKANTIYKVLLETFPATFDQFSQVLLQLMRHRKYNNEILATLNNLQHYTEVASEKFSLGVVRLLQIYSPLKCIKVPAHTDATIFNRWNKIYIKYQTSKYTYFELAEEKITRALKKKSFPDDFKSGVRTYFQIQLNLIDISSIEIPEMRNIVNNTANVLVHISKKPMVDYALMKIFIDIYAELMPVYGEHIIEMLIVNNFLPMVTRNAKEVNNYFDKNFINPNIILLTINDQMSRGDYDVLFSYVNLVKETPRTAQNVLRVHIPSVVFLFTHIFPLHLDAMYNDLDEKYKVTYLCLEIMLQILNGPTDPREEFDQVILDFTFNAVVNYEPAVQTMLRIIRISNVYLHTRMLKECHWDCAVTFTMMNCIKACMNIFIKVFTLHNNKERCLYDTALFRKFLDHDMKPSSLKIAISYLDQAFDPVLPRLACTLVKKVATDPSIPILALLEMNPYQIQNVFLEKLRDPLQEEYVKVAILELITLSIEKQNGLTAAFFDLSHYISKRFGHSESDSIITFIQEYLENIQKDLNYLTSPIQGAVLDLFHTLWMFRKDILVKQLTRGQNFWVTLTDPLFREITLQNKTYSQIFNLLTLELFKSKGKNARINEMLDKFFDKNANYAKTWCTHLVKCMDQYPARLQAFTLLRAWKNLLISSILMYPTCVSAPEIRQLLADTCMEGLLKHFSEPEDIRVLTACADTYLFLIKNWPTTYYSDHTKTFTTLTRVFKFTNRYYNFVDKGYKEAILTVAIKTAKDLQNIAAKNHDLVEEYLESIGAIIEKEYNRISTQDMKSVEQKEFSEWSLLLVFGSRLISMDFVRTHSSWFMLMQFAQKVMMSVGFFMGNPLLFPIAKMGVQCLITYAHSSIDEFMNMEFEEFFDSIRPPKRYINTNTLSYTNALPWHFEDWWLFYIGTLEFVSVLFDKMHTIRLEVFFTFMSIHEDIIRNILRLPRVTAEESALQATWICLHLVHKLLTWRQEWKIFRSDIYYSIIHAIYETTNAVTCIFLRPKVLTFFTSHPEGAALRLVEVIQTEPLVKIMDSLMKVIAMSCLCLLRAAPSLHNLLSPSPNMAYVNDVKLALDFHIPQLYQENPERLTYGTILCLLHFLCKTISYIHTQKVSCQMQPDDVPMDLSAAKGYIALVCPDFAGGYTISERYNLLSSDISGLSAPWLMKLNLTNVTFALEALGSLIATQTFLTLNLQEMKPEAKQHFKRELCSELMYFYEFIRKRFVGTKHYRISDNMVFRRFFQRHIPYFVHCDRSGAEIAFARRCVADETASSSEDPDSDSSFGIGTDGDVDYEQLDPTVFFTSQDFDEIRENLHRYTQDFGGLGTSSRGHNTPTGEGWYYGERVVNGRTYRVTLDRIQLRYPRLPKLKDGDYLLYLTHWFIFFCDLIH